MLLGPCTRITRNWLSIGCTLKQLLQSCLYVLQQQWRRALYMSAGAPSPPADRRPAAVAHKRLCFRPRAAGCGPSQSGRGPKNAPRARPYASDHGAHGLLAVLRGGRHQRRRRTARCCCRHRQCRPDHRCRRFCRRGNRCVDRCGCDRCRLAGAAAARAIADSIGSKSVIVLEGQNRVGGR